MSFSTFGKRQRRVKSSKIVNNAGFLNQTSAKGDVDAWYLIHYRLLYIEPEVVLLFQQGHLHPSTFSRSELWCKLVPLETDDDSMMMSIES